jgi:hypothetical protein
MTRTKIRVTFLLSILTCVSGFSANAQNKSDRERDDLLGMVNSVFQETVLTDCRSGRLTDRFSSTEEYDSSGRATGNRNRFIVDDPISRMLVLVYPFDESITRMEKPTYWENGIPPGWKYGPLIYTDVYTYDNKTRRSEWLRYGRDGKIELRSSNVFDEHGRLGEAKSYNADGALADWNVITRDQRGNVVESAFHKEDG